MDKKNLMPMAAGPVNPTTTGELPAQLTELSEEALQQIIGGKNETGEIEIDLRDILDDGLRVTPENGNLRRRR